MRYLIIFIAIFSAQSIQQSGDPADANTPTEPNEFSNIQLGILSDPNVLADSNIEIDLNDPKSLTSTEEVAINRNPGLGGINKGPGIGGITPPDWWKDIVPPVCKTHSIDGRPKTPTCCTKDGSILVGGKFVNIEGMKKGCRKFGSYIRECYNAASVWCCHGNGPTNSARIARECERAGEEYPITGDTPVRDKAPETDRQPAPVENEEPENLPPDQVIDPLIKLPGTLELEPFEFEPALP